VVVAGVVVAGVAEAAAGVAEVGARAAVLSRVRPAEATPAA